MKNTRRDFLKMTTAGLAGCMIPSLATATTVKKGVSARSSVYDSVQYDVVVVGAGASGIPAAIAARGESGIGGGGLVAGRCTGRPVCDVFVRWPASGYLSGNDTRAEQPLFE